MIEQPLILFCEDPINDQLVDPDYIDEKSAAQQLGFKTLLFNFDDLLDKDRSQNATKHIQAANTPTPIIYRGWMLTPAHYSALYADLLAKNYVLINSPIAYQNCHYLPDSLPFISSDTPITVFEPIVDEKSIDLLIEKARIFNNQAVILKDYVKSEKHDWETACYVADASNSLKLKQTIQRLIELRGDFLNVGIVVREFIELKELTVHSKSGMPLTEEYRLFFFNNQLVGIYDYWEEGEYSFEKPVTLPFEIIAKQVDSLFFSMDIARKKNGEFIIIELGDGQVSGLPDKLDRHLFYSELKKQLS